MFVGRFSTAMFYPGNYGFIPHTLSGDGDPTDVLVIGRNPVVPGAIIRVNPVGVLIMEDESGQDEKIIAKPIAKLHYYDNIESHEDIRPILREQNPSISSPTTRTWKRASGSRRTDGAMRT